MKPERMMLESQRAGTGTEVPEYLRLSNREMQRTVVDGLTRADGSSELRRFIFLPAVIGMKIRNL